jgi:hypothetical protein
MNSPTKLHSGFNLFVLLAVLVALGTGCATNGRRFVLKEFQATGPAAPDKPLKDITIFIEPFKSATNLTSPEPVSKAEQLPQFTFVEYTDSQHKNWDDESKQLEKTIPKEKMREIGNLRNGFGMILSHVYALNDPGKWLTDSLKMDLEQLGAKVVDSSDANAADLRISGTLQFCRVDIYMKIWGDLVVDLELHPKNGVASQRTIHTDGGTVAWLGSTGEFYKPLRESRQKFSWLAVNEIRKALNHPQ